MKTHFSYIGIPVGGNMHRLKSWWEVVQKVMFKLSNWKVKLLSIGGKLTFIKSVLGAIPTYFVSLYKSPIGIFITATGVA